MTNRIEKLLSFYFASKLRKGQVVTFTEVKRCCEEFGTNVSAIAEDIGHLAHIEVGVKLDDKGAMSGLSAENMQYCPLGTLPPGGRKILYNGTDGSEIARFIDFSDFIHHADEKNTDRK